MSSLIERMMGRLREDDAVPVPAGAESDDARSRGRGRAQRFRKPEDQRQDDVRRSTVSAMMGMGESDMGDDADNGEGVIPSDAVEIGDVTGTASVKGVDHDKTEKDKEPKDAVNPTYLNGVNEPLMSPAVALVAPDVTPQALEPLDPSQVPQPPQAPQQQNGNREINPLDVLLGRNRRSEPAAVEFQEPVRTAESADEQPGPPLEFVGGSGDLREGMPMPCHRPSGGSRLMEIAARFARR